MHRFTLKTLKAHYHLLLTGALIGAAAAGACDPKTIGDESAGNAVCQEGETKDADDGCNTCSCNGGEWACTELACGECMDGDVMPAPDGCNTCSCVEGMWACTLIGCPATEGGEAVCGDGIVEGAEECDDGNAVDGDGCSAGCILEGGGTDGTSTGGETDGTTGGGSGLCGDGVVEGGEQCDDGNIVDDDGCSATCLLEGGVCGDGIVEGAEECDDGNVDNGDNCSAACTNGPGWALICAEPVQVDPFMITSAAIVADALKVDVEFGGGCETHDFSYCWDGIFLESFPVQIHTMIGHDGHDDACDAWIMETHEFDLSDLKKAYQDGYQTQTGDIAIHVEGWDQTLMYSF